MHHSSERIMTMDRILFGDNQFFGVNHMSEEKARAQAMRFKDTSSMIEVLDTAYEMGLRTFMCTTHDVIGDIADHVAADPVKYPDYQFYPGMPYAHKYANMVGEIGMVETLRSAAPGGMIETVIKGARSALRKDVDQLMQMLVDSEMKRFANVKTPVIFLQNVVTDLLLGLKMYDLLREFHDHVKKAHGAEAGFFSMNLPRLASALKSAGVDTPIICCNYNKIGRAAIGRSSHRRHVGVGVRRYPGGRSHQVDRRTFGDRVDRVRRIVTRQYSPDRRSHPSLQPRSDLLRISA
jgi:hypothetical protein